MDFKPSLKAPVHKMPAAPKDSTSIFVVGLQLLFILTMLRLVMLVYGVRIRHIPLFDPALYWIIDAVKFQLWAWGITKLG